ncbi:hypothetical protein HNY73_021559 [Argiope bruennichi]|uniref:Uncharacterized protein n=1 Tax=Argiope bruennichi TaxID=94029 RepID=A0A8T0E093_ARGBR|nr:hypothetical protein HNY73_021559 [Argiope bruennichi]
MDIVSLRREPRLFDAFVPTSVGADISLGDSGGQYPDGGQFGPAGSPSDSSSGAGRHQIYNRMLLPIGSSSGEYVRPLVQQLYPRLQSFFAKPGASNLFFKLLLTGITNKAAQYGVMIPKDAADNDIVSLSANLGSIPSVPTSVGADISLGRIRRQDPDGGQFFLDGRSPSDLTVRRVKNSGMSSDKATIESLMELIAAFVNVLGSSSPDPTKSTALGSSIQVTTNLAAALS